jgi:hypothetical protein
LGQKWHPADVSFRFEERHEKDLQRLMSGVQVSIMM